MEPKSTVKIKVVCQFVRLWENLENKAAGTAMGDYLA